MQIIYQEDEELYNQNLSKLNLKQILGQIKNKFALFRRKYSVEERKKFIENLINKVYRGSEQGHNLYQIDEFNVDRHYQEKLRQNKNLKMNLNEKNKGSYSQNKIESVRSLKQFSPRLSFDGNQSIRLDSYKSVESKYSLDDSKEENQEPETEMTYFEKKLQELEQESQKIKLENERLNLYITIQEQAINKIQKDNQFVPICYQLIDLDLNQKEIKPVSRIIAFLISDSQVNTVQINSTLRKKLQIWRNEFTFLASENQILSKNQHLTYIYDLYGDKIDKWLYLYVIRIKQISNLKRY